MAADDDARGSLIECGKRIFTRDEILAALTVEPCHITGEHDPQHTLKYICRDQLTVALRRLLDLLDVTVEDLPRRLGPTCGWCQRDSDDKPLLDAWAERKPMEFSLRGLTHDRPISDEPIFATYLEAWARGAEMVRAKQLRGFSIYVTTDNVKEPRRVGWYS